MSNSDPADLIVRAARCASKVSGLTHKFYRYPARFSPAFARAAIEAFSEPGDWVVDPFAGGGTTLVEAMALGRHALGIDVSALSTFVCKAKTLLLTDSEAAEYDRWCARVPTTINMRDPGARSETYAKAGYYRNLEGRHLWRLRKAIEQALASVGTITLEGSATLARCAVLRAAQWALDGRKSRPSVPQLRAELQAKAFEMGEGARVFRDRCQTHSDDEFPRSVNLNRSTRGAHIDKRVREVSPPRLIVTSPPYPGIHVLYHRWQVDGRRETPAPFWIAGVADGAPSRHYTMGDRQQPSLRRYFEELKGAFTSVAAMSGPNTTIVQMVSFARPDWQLPKYLSVMERCGLVECHPWRTAETDGRLWRNVPNRKWHANQNQHAPGSREVVLVHRKARGAAD